VVRNRGIRGSVEVHGRSWHDGGVIAFAQIAVWLLADIVTLAVLAIRSRRSLGLLIALLLCGRYPRPSAQVLRLDASLIFPGQLLGKAGHCQLKLIND
jgi:hypothetical protein